MGSKTSPASKGANNAKSGSSLHAARAGFGLRWLSFRLYNAGIMASDHAWSNFEGETEADLEDFLVKVSFHRPVRIYLG